VESQVKGFWFLNQGSGLRFWSFGFRVKNAVFSGLEFRI